MSRKFIVLCVRIGFFICLFIYFIGYSNIGCSRNENVAYFNGKTITISQYIWEMDNLSEHTRASIKTIDDKSEFVQRLITQELLIEEAVKRGIPNDESIRYNIESYRKNLLINELLRREFEGMITVTEEEVKQYYYKNIGQFTTEVVEASHILVKKREDAEMILKLLSHRNNFPELAVRFSVGPSAKSGGSLGEIARGQMMSDFEEALFLLEKPGDISSIVETDFGFHIIKLDKSKTIKTHPLKDVSATIRRIIADKKEKDLFENYVEDLKKRINIEIDEDILKEVG